jgi:hypothetical protein
MSIEGLRMLLSAQYGKFRLVMLTKTQKNEVYRP